MYDTKKVHLCAIEIAWLTIEKILFIPSTHSVKPIHTYTHTLIPRMTSAKKKKNCFFSVLFLFFWQRKKERRKKKFAKCKSHWCIVTEWKLQLGEYSEREHYGEKELDTMGSVNAPNTQSMSCENEKVYIHQQTIDLYWQSHFLFYICIEMFFSFFFLIFLCHYKISHIFQRLHIYSAFRRCFPLAREKIAKKINYVDFIVTNVFTKNEWWMRTGRQKIEIPCSTCCG